MAAAALALIMANSPLRAGYEAVLHSHLGPLSLAHWINDGLMALFFLLVGLEIKREMLDGQLSTWPRRVLPGIAAAGGMAVIALLGNRIPASLRIFLAALAIIDDLGAVLTIALFYTADLSLPDLAGAGIFTVMPYGLNRLCVRRLLPYLILGGALWFFVYRSGIHATLAGVILAFTIPIERTTARPDGDARSPLHRLEHALHLPVGYLVVPIFGLANAGVPVLTLPADAFAAPVTLGATFGLLLGKVTGVLGLSMLAIRLAMLAIRLGIAHMPAHATRLHMLGVALLCGIGFTMSIFITLLAFPGAPMLQAEAKLGVLIGSLFSGLLGYGVLALAIRRQESAAV